MTHFTTLVLVPDGTADIKDAVGRLLAPYDENDEWGREGSRWDWWMIGGRSTGLLDAEYDPQTDPAHIQTCWLCGGTGDRASHRGEPKTNQHPTGCNGCLGTGKSTSWPTKWQARDSDVMPASRVDFDRIKWLPTAVVTPDGKWHERIDGGFGMFAAPRGDEKPEDQWGREFSALIEAHRDAIAVVVDCHV